MKTPKRFVPALLALLILTAPALADVTVTVLDVGTADAIVIEADGRAMLIDTGKRRDAQTVVDAVSAYSSLDMVVLTHPHADHIGGFKNVADAVSIDRLVTTFATNPGVAIYDELMAIIDALALPVDYPNVGDTFALGDALFTVYAPHPVLYPSLNDTSIVLMMEAYGLRVLFSGDAEASSEVDMLQNVSQCPLSADILKLAHHGKDTSSTFAFISAVQPSTAIASTGSEPDGDVIATLLDAGVFDIRTTAAQGDIVFTLTPSGIIWR